MDLGYIRRYGCSTEEHFFKMFLLKFFLVFLVFLVIGRSTWVMRLYKSCHDNSPSREGYKSTRNKKTSEKLAFYETKRNSWSIWKGYMHLCSNVKRFPQYSLEILKRISTSFLICILVYWLYLVYIFLCTDCI